MARLIFVSYISIAFLLACAATYTQSISVPFNYEQEFTLLEFLKFSPYLFAITTAFLAGYKLAHIILRERKKIANLDIFKPFEKKLLLVAKIAQVTLLVYFVFELSDAIFHSSSSIYDKYYRPLSSKISTGLLLIQGTLPYFFKQRKRWLLFSMAVSIALAIVFSWFNASRSGALALIGLAVIMIERRKTFSLMATLILTIFLIILSMQARGYMDRYSLLTAIEVISAIANTPIESLTSFFSYTFTFSLLHFCYVVRDELGSFNLQDLVYASTPIPSFLWGSIPDYALWRVDIFRPMGAAAEIQRVSSTLLALYFFMLGLLSFKIDNMRAQQLKFSAIGIFALLVVTSFQYNLRTNMWFFCLILLLILSDHILCNVFDRRRTILGKA